MMFSPRQVAHLMNTSGRSALSLYGITADPPAYDVTPGNRVLNRVSSLELAHYTRNTLLHDADIFSMAHSLELRVPFLDQHVARRGAFFDRTQQGAGRAVSVARRAAAPVFVSGRKIDVDVNVKYLP